MNIVVLDGHTLNPGDNPWDSVEALGELTVYDRTEPGRVVERAGNAEIVLTNKTVLDEKTIGLLPNLRFIGVLATGFNVVDVQAAAARGIPVSNVPIYGTDSVVQFTFALLLELCHHAALHDAEVRKGTWRKKDEFCFWETSQIELAGKTMGIVGFGRIGRRVGEIAHAFGMNVLAYDSVPGAAPDYRPFDRRELNELLAEADVVSLHCPQTTDNAGLVNTAFLSTMKKTAFLINTARGGLVVEQDLADALNENRIAGAAADVFSAEPIDENNPLLEAKNLIVTPHIAWATYEARKRLMDTTADNIKAFIDGAPGNVVNDPKSS
jgi:glycerate dehydrogenase